MFAGDTAGYAKSAEGRVAPQHAGLQAHSAASQPNKTTSSPHRDAATLWPAACHTLTRLSNVPAAPAAAASERAT